MAVLFAAPHPARTGGSDPLVVGVRSVDENLLGLALPRGS